MLCTTILVLTSASLLHVSDGPLRARVTRPFTAVRMTTTPSWIAEGNQYFALFGWSVASAGDVNGDGYSDIIVGAPGYYSVFPYHDAGAAFVYLGSSAGLAATPAWAAAGDTTVASYGRSVATAGDVNGDGYSDVIAGAPNYGLGYGKARVYHGSATGLNATPAWTAVGGTSAENLGGSVASAGDINGDGYSDVIVGADFYSNGENKEGRAYVYLGSATGLSTTPAWTAESDQASAYFGKSVTTAGDVNGDGYSDVIVGAYGYANGQNDEGRAFVYHGSAAGLDATPAWTAESDQADAYFGQSVAAAGDVDGDGYSDVIVGADNYSNGQTSEGRAYVYRGSAAGLSATPSWIAEPDQAFSRFGESTASAGDLDGDGYSDVIVGAAGGVFVYLGSAAGLATTPAWIIERSDQSFAKSVATAGDVNGDGYPDIIVGAPEYDNGQEEQWKEGRAYVFQTAAPTAVPSPGEAEPGLRIDAIRPNPFRSNVAVHYVLRGAGRARLSVHDVRGRRVAMLADRFEDAGPHAVTWDGRDARGEEVGAGVYWVRLESGGVAVALKLVRE